MVLIYIYIWKLEGQKWSCVLEQKKVPAPGIMTMFLEVVRGLGITKVGQTWVACCYSRLGLGSSRVILAAAEWFTQVQPRALRVPNWGKGWWGWGPSSSLQSRGTLVMYLHLVLVASVTVTQIPDCGHSPSSHSFWPQHYISEGVEWSLEGLPVILSNQNAFL